jgi:hypothetical protein
MSQTASDSRLPTRLLASGEWIPSGRIHSAHFCFRQANSQKVRGSHDLGLLVSAPRLRLSAHAIFMRELSGRQLEAGKRIEIVAEQKRVRRPIIR